MRYRRLDDAGDYVFGQGSTQFLIDTPGAVGQAVLTRLKMKRGDWFLDSSVGTPWKEAILGKHLDTYDAAIREVILDTPNVTEIADYASVLDASTRKLTVAATINTAFGQTTITTVL